MLALETVIKKNISFIHIDKLVLDKSGTNILEFTIWEHITNSTEIRGYRMRYPLEKAYNILNELFMRRIPSNYYIFELKDNLILAGLYNKGGSNFVTNQVIGNHNELNEVVMKLEENSFDDIIIKLVEKGATVKNNLSEDFFPLNNLVFNRDNLNVSCRYFNKNTGFHTNFLYDLFARSIVVRTLNPITDIPLVLDNKEVDGMYESIVELNDLSCKSHELFIEGRKVDKRFIISMLPQDYFVREFSTVFNHQVALKAIDAYASIIFDYSDKYMVQNDEFKQPQYSRPIEKICRVAPVSKLPTTKDFISDMKAYNLGASLDNLDLFLDNVKERFGANTRNIVCNLFKDFASMNRNTLLINVGIRQKELQKHFAMQGMRAHALKSTLCMNDVFMTMFAKTSELFTDNNKHIIESIVFDASVCIETFPVTCDIGMV